MAYIFPMIATTTKIAVVAYKIHKILVGLTNKKTISTKKKKILKSTVKVYLK